MRGSCIRVEGSNPSLSARNSSLFCLVVLVGVLYMEPTKKENADRLAQFASSILFASLLFHRRACFDSNNCKEENCMVTNTLNLAEKFLEEFNNRIRPW